MTRNGLIFGGALIAAIAISTAAGTSGPPPVAPDPGGRPLTASPTSPPRTIVEPDPPARDVGVDTTPPPTTDTTAPRRLVRKFAEQSINWNWRTVARQFDRTANLATPQLRVVIERHAAQTARDVTLARDRVGNRGRVVAIDLHGAGATRDAVVVAREIAYANGTQSAGSAEHRVYLATLSRQRGSWRVATWEPAR